MSSHTQQTTEGAPDRAPMTLPRLAEMKLNAEPIVMVTARHRPSPPTSRWPARRPSPWLSAYAAHRSWTPWWAMDEMLSCGGRPGQRQAAGASSASFRRAVEGAGDRARDGYVNEGGRAARRAQARRGGVSAGQARLGDRGRHPGDDVVFATAPNGRHGLALPSSTQGSMPIRAKSPRNLALEVVLVVARPLAHQARSGEASGGSGSAAPPHRTVPGRGTTCSGHRDAAGSTAKFVEALRRPAGRRWTRGVGEYARQVRYGAFPGPEHSYSIEPAELDAFRRYLEQESLAGLSPSGATGRRRRSEPNDERSASPGNRSPPPV